MARRQTLAVLLVVQLALNVAFAIGLLLLSDDAAEYVDLNKEANLPSWWSALLLAAIAGLAAGLAWSDDARSRRRLWVVASLVFLYLSFDEVSRLHEQLGLEVAGDGLNDAEGRAWVLVLGPVFVLLALALARLTRALTATQRALAVAGVALYGLALALELFSVVDSGARGRVAVSFEENAEILGSNLILVGLLGALLDRITIRRRATATG